MDAFTKENGIYVFGRFQLDTLRRTLTSAGTPIKLAPRLFDLLVYLVENPGRVIEKDELLSAVWAGRVVEESNLGQAIFALRKALNTEGAAESLISTAPGRGYRFTAPVERLADAASAAPPIPAILTGGALGGTKPAPQHAPRHIQRGLLAVALMVAVLLVWRLLPTAPAPPPFAPPAHSVAVLPFTNLSGDPAQDYFSDGLSEELIDALSTIDAIRVAARVSAFSFRHGQATIQTIARKLNVGAVLEGSVRRDGNRLRIAVRLINAGTGFPMWSQTYDRDRFQDDLLAVQSDIAREVSAALEVKLLAADETRLTAGGTHNPRALDAFLRGTAAGLVMDDAHAKLAVSAYTEAITLDPGYAAAYAGRAGSLNFMFDAATDTDAARLAQYQADARHDIDKAILLAPDLAYAHRVKAYIHKSALDVRGQLAEIELAYALAPGDASILSFYGLTEAAWRHSDAGLLALEKAARLDPLRPGAYRNLANGQFYMRRYDDALESFRRADALDSTTSATKRTMVANVYLAKGDAASAARLCTGIDSWFANECLAIADRALGREAEADAQLARLQARMGDQAAYNYADIYAQWGDKDHALQWLQTAYRLHDPGLAELRIDPFLDPIRQTPGYHALERELNFPP